MRVSALLLLGGVMLPALANACMMTESQKAELYRTFDTDKDGALTLEEYLAGETTRIKRAFSYVEHEGFVKRYKDMDATGQGKVTEKEFSPVSLQKCM